MEMAIEGTLPPSKVSAARNARHQLGSLHYRKDKERYLQGTGMERAEMEIPVSYHSIAHRNLDQLNVGTRPLSYLTKVMITKRIVAGLL